MMRALAAHIVFLVILLSNAWSAEPAKPADRLRSLGDIATEMASYFPKVEARVLDASGDRLTLSLGKKGGLVPGIVLSIWREGREIYHPLTGAVIGRAEEEVGSAEVTEVGDIASFAAVRKRLKQPREGDRARITPRKIKIGLIPAGGAYFGIVSDLAERLTDSGRFSVINEAKIIAFLKGRNESDAESARAAAAGLGLDATALVSTKPVDGRQLVTVKLFSGETGKLMAAVTAEVDVSLKTSSQTGFIPFFALSDDGGYEGPDIPFEAKLFVPADVNGDGAAEGVFSDGRRLYVFKEELSGWREVWTEPDKDAIGEGHINIDVADINANGIPEIFVTAVKDGNVISYSVEAGAEGFRRIAVGHVFLRVVSKDRRDVLIGLEPGGSGRTSTIKEYVWSAGKYIPGPAFPLPERVGLYDFVFADFGGKGMHIVARDHKNRLVVYSGTEPVWTGREIYKGMETTIPGSLASTNIRVVKTRLIAADIDGDGLDEVILQRNINRRFFMGFKSADIHVMSWGDERLEQKRVFTGLAGPVLDLAVQRNSGLHLMSLVREPAGLLSASRTFVTRYRLDGKAQ